MTDVCDVCGLRYRAVVAISPLFVPAVEKIARMTTLFSYLPSPDLLYRLVPAWLQWWGGAECARLGGGARLLCEAAGAGAGAGGGAGGAADANKDTTKRELWFGGHGMPLQFELRFLPQTCALIICGTLGLFFWFEGGGGAAGGARVGAGTSYG